MSDVAHKDRSHAQWSASATARNSVCAGAIAMSSLCEDVEREAAAWGTACHQISEKCLHTNDPDVSRFIGTTEESGKFKFVVDEEMANTAQVYVDYCNQCLADHDSGLEETDFAPFWIEHPLSLSSLNPPLQAGGTADFIAYYPKRRLLEVVDLKGGRGVTVDVVGNPQGRSYAIGAILSLPGLDVERVKVTIVQPRVGDGLPKSDEFHVAELFDWTHDLLKLMQRAKDALDEFNALGGNSVLFDEWADKWLTPGQCTFCTAKPICPALRKKALAAMPALARQWHEDVTLTTPPTLTNLAKMGSVEELEHDLAGLDELEAWASARRAYAKQLAEQGTKFKDWMLVDSIGHRKFVEKDEKALTATLMKTFALTKEKVVVMKIKSPAQLEKALTAAQKKEFTKLEKTLWVKPVVGKNLVRRDKSIREEAQSLTERFNEEVKE